MEIGKGVIGVGISTGIWDWGRAGEGHRAGGVEMETENRVIGISPRIWDWERGRG